MNYVYICTEKQKNHGNNSVKYAKSTHQTITATTAKTSTWSSAPNANSPFPTFFSAKNKGTIASTDRIGAAPSATMKTRATSSSVQNAFPPKIKNWLKILVSTSKNITSKTPTPSCDCSKKFSIFFHPWTPMRISNWKSRINWSN